MATLTHGPFLRPELHPSVKLSRGRRKDVGQPKRRGEIQIALTFPRMNLAKCPRNPSPRTNFRSRRGDQRRSRNDHQRPALSREGVNRFHLRSFHSLTPQDRVTDALSVVSALDEHGRPARVETAQHHRRHRLGVERGPRTSYQLVTMLLPARAARAGATGFT